MYISREIIEEIDINDFPPGKIVEQLKFFPEIFEFLKSKEKEMGKIRPLITFLTGIAIWGFRKRTSFKRKIPSNFFPTLWDRFKSNRESAKSMGDMVESLEPELWRYFLTTIKSETMRNKDISREEIGTGALVFSIVTMGLLFAFGDEHTLEELRNIVENKT